MPWFKKARTRITASKEKASRVPEGLWVKCPGCSQIIYKKDLTANLNVCPKCNHHFRVTASERLRMLLDDEWTEHDPNLVSTDPLKFTDTKPYKARLKASQATTGVKEAVIVASGTLDRIPLVVASMEYGFIGGSMGVVVGEKIARAIERAIEARSPVLIVCSSGGARMMEGALSLMQMAKVCAALARLDRERLPYIAVLTDPTTGGVTASFAMLGDLNIAEPKALIGFAGPRVIEQTIRQKLPEGFQRSEFLLEKGMIDMIVDRREMKAVIAKALRFMGAASAQAAVAAELEAALPAAGEPVT
jgi:acetyl-CoA carboxylase carboxyl transferase subunit beta